MNVHYEVDEIREAHFVVNGRDGSSTLTMKGARCIVDCAPIIPPAPENETVVIVEEETHLWSDPVTWKKLDNRIPLGGDVVVVPSDHYVIYDMGNSPIYESIEIHGEVVFKEG